MTQKVQIQYQCFSKSDNWPSSVGINSCFFGGPFDEVDTFHFGAHGLSEL